MRKIEYRAKTNAGNWVYGYYVRHETRQICLIGDDRLSEDEVIHYIVQDGFADWNMPKSLMHIKVVPETVGQYTGLEDENDTKIYEGDILEYTFLGREFKGQVVFGKATYQIKDINENLDLFPLFGFSAIAKVIGNAIDDPELA